MLTNLSKRTTVCLSAVMLLLAINSCKQDPRNNPSQTDTTYSKAPAKQEEIYVDLEKILKKNARPGAVDIHVVYDHYFRAPKEYRGYSFSEILDSVIRSDHFDTTNAIVVFKCNDGYKPEMDLSKIYAGAKGYIVYKDMNPNNKRNWPDSVYSKFKPYYLAWDNVKPKDNSYAWPYSLTALRLIPMSVEYKSIYPFKDPSLAKGFNLFKNNCMKCHSINKVGGEMGPEFNIPINITEYWKEDNIISFARDPRSFRYNSRMPAITEVPDSDMKEIISYFKYMKNNKLSK